MTSVPPLYQERPQEDPAEGEHPSTAQHQHPLHPHQQVQPTLTPQHAYFDPNRYHYNVPPTTHQPGPDHHMHHHYYVQHKNRPDLPNHVDPVWPSPAINDVYLPVDPGTVDFQLQPNGTVPLDDMLLYPIQPATREAPSTRPSAPKTKKAKKGRPSRYKDGGDSTYVLRIHEMLENAEKESQTHIVSWQPHGRAFRIHNEALFVSQIMPRYFKAKIGSFQRWLRAWGFARMTEGKDRGAWYHRYFVRGVTSFCKDMTRQQMAHVMVDWPPAGQVPDFYSAASGRTLSEQEPAEQQDQLGANALTNNQDVKTSNHKRLRGTILEDLRQMLDDAENEGHTHIVGWMPHGRAFKIHNKALFEGLMPRYFKTSKVTHLNDTLRIWGFRRLKKTGRDKGCFYHKLFVKGDPSLTRHLTRVQMKECMDVWPPSEGEPDLYLQEATSTSTAIGMNHPTSAPNRAAPTTGMSQEGRTIPINKDSQYPTAPTPTQGYDLSGSHAGPHETVKEESAGASRGDGTYVLRLHEMLEDAEKEGHQHIVSWQPHGRAFRIHKEKEFVEQIMPRYFKAKMNSFLRWCRAWGFVRMTEGRDRGAWYHRYFVRGVTSLSRSLSRQQMLKAMEDWLPPGHVPDFYASGTGGALSETHRNTIEVPQNVTCKNPKQLRGTVPEDLRRMLEDAEHEGNARIVSWLPHGRAFKVHDKVAFVNQILPRYFKVSKFTYFSDALRMWGWHRLKGRYDKGSYYHKLFVRGQPQLTRHLHRIQMKKSMIPWPPSQGEPNLYISPPPLADLLRDSSDALVDAETAVPGLVETETEIPLDDSAVVDLDGLPPAGAGSPVNDLKPETKWQETQV